MQIKMIAVDDEKFALDALTEAIREAAPEAELSAFVTAGEAIAFVKEHPCDVAFLDIRLRGMTGLELALRLKNSCPRINIIFVTGHDEYLYSAIRQHCSGYLFKPVAAAQVREELQNLRYPVIREEKGIYARTFGNFALFANGQAVEFETPRCRELLAFLIDRRGAALTTRQIEAVIWEENQNVLSSQTQVRKAKAALIRTLESAGIGRILCTTSREMWVDTEQIVCDYWQLLDGNAGALNSYHGEYLDEYSWAEPTRAALSGRKNDI